MWLIKLTLNVIIMVILLILLSYDYFKRQKQLKLKSKYDNAIQKDMNKQMSLHMTLHNHYDSNDFNADKHKLQKKYCYLDDKAYDADMIVELLLMFICVLLFIIPEIDTGIHQWQSIPQQKVIMHYKYNNMKHYKIAMKYNRADERSQRNGNAKFTGDLSKAKDNKLWQKNYKRYYANKAWHHYYQVLIRYEKNPIKHFRDEYYLKKRNPEHFK